MVHLRLLLAALSLAVPAAAVCDTAIVRGSDAAALTDRVPARVRSVTFDPAAERVSVVRGLPSASPAMSEPEPDLALVRMLGALCAAGAGLRDVSGADPMPTTPAGF
jgi:hypothetical protein